MEVAGACEPGGVDTLSSGEVTSISPTGEKPVENSPFHDYFMRKTHYFRGNLPMFKQTLTIPMKSPSGASIAMTEIGVLWSES